MCCSSVPLSLTTSRTEFWLSPSAQSVVPDDVGQLILRSPLRREVLVRQHLVHRRTPEVAVREVAAAVERQDHVRAVEDVTLRAVVSLRRRSTVRPIRLLNMS